MLKTYVENIHPRIETLLQYHTYPLTLIYPHSKNLDFPLKHASGSIAIRLVQDDFCQKLIEEIGVPIVATSANYSGNPSPLNYSNISEKLKREVDLVVNHRKDEKTKAKASVIAEYDEEGNLNFLRT